MANRNLVDPNQAAELIKPLGLTFAKVHNPSYVYPPFELYPLAPPPKLPLSELRGVVCDMDGTTTSTEPVCLHSLEWMVRRVTGWMDADRWSGLSRENDYPHVIGNSTTRHIEYLIETYGGDLRVEDYLPALIESILWTVAVGRDDERRREAIETARHLGLRGAIESPEARALIDSDSATLEQAAALAKQITPTLLERFAVGGTSDIVRGGIEIYYARYHQILQGIGMGRGQDLARQLLGDGGRHMIQPMPGVGLFLAALKGWLDPPAAETLFDALADGLIRMRPGPWCDPGRGGLGREAMRRGFAVACGRLASRPARAAIVTSSIAYEAGIVLGELFEMLRAEVAEWPLDKDHRERILEQFDDPQHYYDTIVTASDSSEIRLKPHRDLYSIALHRLGLSPADFDRVLGLEDSESGVVAIRAAGIGLCVAVPFPDTEGHKLDAATQVNWGSLPELMFKDHFFLDVAD